MSQTFSARADWAPRRPTRSATTSVPRTRPAAPVPIDVATLDEWTAANRRAAREYAIHPFITSPCNAGCTCPSRLERRAA